MDRKPDLVRIVLVILTTLLLIGGSLWIMAPFLSALVWATTIAVATWPVLVRLERLFWGRRSLAVMTMVGALLIFLFVPMAALGVAVAKHAGQLADLIPQLMAGQIPEPPPWLAKIPLIGGRIQESWTAVLQDGIEPLLVKLRPHARDILAWVAAQASGAGILVVHLLLTTILTGVLYAQGDVAAHGVRAFAHRLGAAKGERAVILAGEAIRGVALGVVVTAVAQASLGGLGLLLTGVPYAALLTGLMFVLCLVQIGPLLVLGPATVWLFVQGHSSLGTVLLVWTILVGLLDNFLRPWLIRKGADLPLLLIFAGVLGGLLALGALGLFVGPVILAVTYTLLEAWVEEGEPKEAEAAPSAADEVVL